MRTTWRKELLARLLMLTPCDPQFERTMQKADQVIERFEHAYKVLADR